jgi:enoyl-CoA hydratase/carnithine racemase
MVGVLAGQPFTSSIHETSWGVRTITLDRPSQRNALTPDLYREIKEGVLEGWADPEVRVIVIRGSGGSFAVGGDLKHFLSLYERPDIQQLWAFTRSFEEPLPFRTLLECPKPIIAVVDGFCMAGGLVIASCSDAVIATNTSVFGVPEGQVGLADPYCGVLLPRIVGDVRARYLTMTAATIDADTAERWGIVTKLTDTAGLEAEVAAMVAAFQRISPNSASVYKRVINGPIPHMSVTATIDAGWSDEGREGLSAFVAKREPAWQKASD